MKSVALVLAILLSACGGMAASSPPGSSPASSEAPEAPTTPAASSLAAPQPPAEPTVEDKAAAEPGDAVVYACPMHPEVQQSGPGRCPKCGMKLEPAQDNAPDDHAEHSGHGHAE